MPHVHLVAAHVNLGEPGAAAMAMRRLLDVKPAFTAEGFARTVRYPLALLDHPMAALARVERMR